MDWPTVPDRCEAREIGHRSRPGWGRTDSLGALLRLMLVPRRQLQAWCLGQCAVCAPDCQAMVRLNLWQRSSATSYPSGPTVRSGSARKRRGPGHRRAPQSASMSLLDSLALARSFRALRSALRAVDACRQPANPAVTVPQRIVDAYCSGCVVDSWEVSVIVFGFVQCLDQSSWVARQFDTTRVCQRLAPTG